VIAARPHAGRWLVGFEGVTSMNDAEALSGLELEEDVVGEERFFEDGGFALIFLNAAIKGQGHFEALTFAVFS